MDRGAHVTSAPFKILLTGGSGFVGKHLLSAFGDDDQFGREKILATSRRPENIPKLPYVFSSRWDVTKPAPVEWNVRAIIHAATSASALDNLMRPEAVFWQIVDGAKNVIALCEKQTRPPKVLLISSGAVYGGAQNKHEVWSERSVVSEELDGISSGYAAGKRACEKMFFEAARRGCCELVVARLFSFSGRHLPLDRHFAIGNFVRDAAGGGPIRIRGNGKSIRTYLDGDDMARWLIESLKRNLPEAAIIHIGSEREVSILEVAKLIAEEGSCLSGREIQVVVEGKTSRIDGVDRYVPSTKVTRELLNVVESVSLRESTRIMLNGERASRGG